LKVRQSPIPESADRRAIQTVAWTSNDVKAITQDPDHTAPLIGPDDFKRVSPRFDVWDAWPIQNRDGSPTAFEGGVTLWMALTAPHREDPDERHGVARIHLFRRNSAGWHHLGPVLPQEFSPGSREWSGSAVLDADRRGLTLYFTATGHSGEAEPTFAQRLFSARATLIGHAQEFQLGDWRELTEFVRRDPTWYMASDAGTGKVGTIKAFRDPGYFYDPVSGQHYVFFAASLANSQSAFNGVIGAAVSGDGTPDSWATLPPILSADTLNNELERPHALFCNGLYYLFWSTQAHVFNPDGPTGPTGLYGMVSEQLDCGWRPLNGSGLVFANPRQAPAQAYSWLVLPGLSVISFVDNWGQTADIKPRRFGASFSPELRLKLDGASALLQR